MKLKKLLLFSLSLVFALSLTFGLGGAFKAFAADGETGTKLFTGAHVSLTEDIVTKFEYTASAGYTSASYTFTYMGKTTEAKTATVIEGENTIEFAEANPARIGETIIANLTLTGEGKAAVTDTCEFSVANYLGTLLTAAPSTFTEIKTQEQYVAMRTLAANLVNYSAKTQEYIGLTDTSSSLLTTETVKNFVGSMEPNGTDATVGPLTETAKYGFLGASLLLDGRVSVCFYFVAESTENLTLEIAFDGGSKTTLTEIAAAPEINVKEGVTAYKAVLEGVPAIDMDKKFTAKLLSNGTVVGNEVTYSVKSYAYAMLSSDNAKMKSLATAIYNYGLSAKSYVEYQQIDTGSVGYTIGNSVYTMTAENVTNGWNQNTADMILNAVQKNGWIYSVRGVYGGKSGYLVRYDYKTNKQIAVSKIVENLQKTHENAAVFTYGEKVYLYDAGNGKWLSLPLLFETGDEWDTDSGLPIDINLGDYVTNFENIHVFEDLGLVTVYTSGKIVVLKDGAVQATYTVPPATKNRMGGGKNGCLYYTANSEYNKTSEQLAELENNTLSPKVYVFDVKNGNKNTVLLPNALSKEDNNIAVTGVFELDGKLFYSLFSWKGGPLKSCMQSVSFSIEQRLDSPHKGIDEVIAEGGTLTNVKAKAANVGGTVKGVVTDGKYFYMANYAGYSEDAEQKKTHYTQILKTDMSGNVIGKSAKFANGGAESYSDTTYLLYKDGYVYAFSGQFSSIYRIKTDDITADGTSQVEPTTALAFTAEDGTTAIAAHAMAYDEVNDRYAIRNDSTLYLVDGKTMKAYKTVSVSFRDKAVGVAADGKYIYALYEKRGGLAFVVYDWSGNKVKDVAVAGFIMEEPDTANIPSMVIYGGRTYIFAKPWQGTYGNSVFIYVW